MEPPLISVNQIFAAEDPCGVIAVAGSSARFSLAVIVQESPGEPLPYTIDYAWSAVSDGDAPVTANSHAFIYDIPESEVPPPVIVTVTVTVTFTGTSQVRTVKRTRTVQPITPSEEALVCALQHYRARLNYPALVARLLTLGVIGLDPDRGGPHNLPARLRNLLETL